MAPKQPQSENEVRLAGEVLKLRAELERVTKEREHWRQQAEAAERMAQRFLNAEAQVAALKTSSKVDEDLLTRIDAALPERLSGEGLDECVARLKAENERLFHRTGALVALVKHLVRIQCRHCGFRVEEERTTFVRSCEVCDRARRLFRKQATLATLATPTEGEKP